MKRILAIGMAALMMVVFCGAALAEPTKLTVRGTGVVSVEADQAQIVLGVRETSTDVLEAQATVNAKINAIYAALLEAGIEQKDIGTESLYIYANYDYSQDEAPLIGYTATNTISILTSDISRVGEYIDLAFENGANTLDTVNFSARETEEAQREALQLAVASAYEKAEIIADAADMSIKSVTAIDESADYYGGDMGAKYSNSRVSDGGAMDESTMVQASTLQISASVLVEFELAGEEG